MRTPKLRAWIALAIAVLPAAVAAQVKWDMATPFPETNYHTKNARLFVEDVLKESGGQLVITMHSNASLFKMPEIKRAVSGGQAQLGDILLGAYGNEDPFSRSTASRSWCRGSTARGACMTPPSLTSTSASPGRA